MSVKSFSLPKEIASDISNTIEVVKNNIGFLNYKVVPLDAIEFDPTNPRQLAITREDVNSGLNEGDILFEKKQNELESLQNMAETIKKYGIRNPVEIYKFGSKYRLIHGERRCLSSLLAGKKDIPAKILDDKPNGFDIKLLQLIENVQREDLSLIDFLNNVRIIIDEYRNNVEEGIEVNPSFLAQVINKSKTQCFNILSVINAPDEIQNLIKSGAIQNLEKAAIITGEKDPLKRKDLLEACLKGATVSQLKQTKQSLKKLSISAIQPIQKKVKPGKKASKIYMGETKCLGVVAKLIKLVLKDSSYKHCEPILNVIPLDDYDSCSIAFKKLVQLMEKVEAN